MLIRYVHCTRSRHYAHDGGDIYRPGCARYQVMNGRHIYACPECTKREGLGTRDKAWELEPAEDFFLRVAALPAEVTNAT